MIKLNATARIAQARQLIAANDYKLKPTPVSEQVKLLESLKQKASMFADWRMDPRGPHNRPVLWSPSKGQPAFPGQPQGKVVTPKEIWVELKKLGWTNFVGKYGTYAIKISREDGSQPLIIGMHQGPRPAYIGTTDETNVRNETDYK